MKAAVAVMAAAVLAAGCSSDGIRHAARSDPPIIVPWHRVGDISLGEPVKKIEAEYGSLKKGYYRLHGSKVWIWTARGRVRAVDFKTGYYRTKSGFGVGSRIPSGHAWHGFVYDSWNKGLPCHCWTKVGLGQRSLPARGTNFLKPWFIIHVRHGQITEFYFDRSYRD